MLFRQLFDPETATYTYLIADAASGKALLIDPVLEQVERDKQLLQELGLGLAYTLETHVHADHVTAAARLREALGSQTVLGQAAGVDCADVALADGESLSLGAVTITALATPGHTSGCTSYLWRGVAGGDRLFTGDTLLIRGCGRTDFQQGYAAQLFHSVRDKLFQLPDETLVCPGHDYRGRTVSTIGEEKRFNPRLGLEVNEATFVEIMSSLDLPYPKRIDIAVPANLTCGAQVSTQAESPHGVSDALLAQGRQDATMWLGDGI